ncbi:tetraspanin-8-like isoform X2 [Kryptolebias marmoratus]|uniref:tetraspanin-8-like isoform X2 n=1 Tax=Kryptolebias marmoratus TaxID=37003 RepID=UPI0007F8706F|nr:tetraspanin-8-like isoform X2 [Kryptolebias marmoratus]
MQKSSVVVVADKTSLKRPFIFANAVHMALCFFMLKMTVIWHGDLLQTGKMVPSIPVAMMYAIEVGCLLLSVLGVFGACKGKRWCLILKRVVRDESKLLAMMPLSGPSKGNRTLLHNIQEEFECCGLIEGYKDWGSSIPASCNCHYPGKCIRLRGSATLGAPKNQYVYREPCLPIYVSELKLAFFLVMAIQFGSAVFWIILLVMSIKLMGQIKKKQEFIALLQSNRYVPGAF